MITHRREQYNEMLNRLFLEDRSRGYDKGLESNFCRNITFQVTEDCNMKCVYCYQHNKKPNVMSFDVAKQFIDDLVTGSPKITKYIPADTVGLVIEFIGGEPFLEVELMDKIVDYFIDKCIELHHPWATRFRISISSNGLLYFQPKVQEFINKHRERLSLSISIDGNKELHDSCRIDLAGNGTYDRAIAAVYDYVKTYHIEDMPSKMTIAPGNVDKLYEAIVSMIEHGYDGIHFNTVFEEGWTVEHAKIYYEQLKLLSDYLIDNNLPPATLAPFDKSVGKPIDPSDDRNWCGGTGSMLAIDWQGNIYPCIRYMPNAVGDNQKPYVIGNVKDGIMYNEETCDKVNCLTCITRRSQSTDECFYCPIASGCAWCSGHNYETFGTPNKRATFSCIMHKARILALSYFWNKYYKVNSINEIYTLYVPDDWALEIINEDELNMLKKLAEKE